jgi:hypothetical protein
MDRLPERGRVAREAEQARQSEATKKPTKSRSQPPATRVRVKVVWEVCSGAGTVVKTFPYPEKAAAEAKTKALTMSTRRAHMLRAAKVPME